MSVAGTLLVLLLGATPARGQNAPFELRDGDRVAFVGNTFFEREQAHSYLETLLATHWPDRNVTFRNLAWSGDTVFGHARAGFETHEQGFERLLKVARDAKPTVLFISYGMSESFEGEKGLTPFRQGLDRLLDKLGELKVRETVLVSPIRHEDLGRPFPDPSQHNKHLRRYIDVMKEAAAKRGHRFVDLFELMGTGNKSQKLTDNGIHLTPYGYWRAALAIEKGLGLPPRDVKWQPDGRIKPELAEKFRQLTVAKNVQVFNQWRPQNETYIFGFRRNEQGQNAREMPMFDKPIAELEAQMATVRAGFTAIGK
jgi:lysophospholipase L1-like esterase